MPSSKASALSRYSSVRTGSVSISIAATRCEKSIKLTNANAINKSYPHFYEDYKHLGGKIK